MFAGRIMIDKLFDSAEQKNALSQWHSDAKLRKEAAAYTTRKGRAKFYLGSRRDYLITTFLEMIFCPVLIVMKYTPSLQADEGTNRLPCELS